MSDDANRSELIDKWDKIFRDICREIVCPPSVDGQPVDGRPLEIGWQRDAGDFDEKGLLQSVADGFEEFRNYVEEDADTRLGGVFDLDAEATADDFLRSADLALESDAVGNSSFFEKSQGPGDSSFFDPPDGGPTPLSEMLSSDFELYDSRWRYSKWSLSGWLERCLCEPLEIFDNEDPMYPWDTSALCEYGGPWRRKFEPVVRCLFWVLVAAAGPAFLDLFYLGMVLRGAKESVFPSPEIATATHFVAAGVTILWILEMRAFWRKSRRGFFR